MKKIKVKVTGMRGASCENRINAAVHNAFPVLSAVSSHTQGETVICTEKEIPDGELRSVIENGGYRVAGFEKHSEVIALKSGGPNLYEFQSQEGGAVITEYMVLPGVWLAFKDVHTFSFENCAEYPDHLLEITHCREGRLECESEHKFFYLEKGDIAIHRASCSHAMLRCPTGHYHGVSIVIHPKQAQGYAERLLEAAEIDIASILPKFSEWEDHFIIRSTERLEHIFTELYTVPEPIRKEYFKVKVLELLLLLSCRDQDVSRTKQHTYTKMQIALTKRVFAFVEEHKGERVTIAQLADELLVSVGELKRSFFCVYGETVYQCIRAYKMYRAAAALTESSRTIADIAGELGYDNSSKFAKAFREVMGVSPAQYRKKTNLHLEEALRFGLKTT